MVIYRHACLFGISAFVLMGMAGVGTARAAERYVAELQPLNAEVLGRSASGTATFEIEGGRLSITVRADGLAPNVMRMQHYHGFAKGKDATCPTPQADANGDGLIDLVETEPMAGTTMVPLHGDPAGEVMLREPTVLASDQPACVLASASVVRTIGRLISLSRLQ